jgi:hypothetical protein
MFQLSTSPLFFEIKENLNLINKLKKKRRDFLCKNRGFLVGMGIHDCGYSLEQAQPTSM